MHLLIFLLMYSWYNLCYLYISLYYNILDSLCILYAYCVTCVHIHHIVSMYICIVRTRLTHCLFVCLGFYFRFYFYCIPYPKVSPQIKNNCKTGVDLLSCTKSTRHNLALRAGLWQWKKTSTLARTNTTRAGLWLLKNLNTCTDEHN